MSQSPAKLVLTKARSLIADRRCWLQHGWKNGNRDAESRCAYQAIVDAGELLGLDPERSLWLLAGVIAGQGADPRDAIPGFNDCQSHAMVLEMFGQAIEKA